MPNPAIEYAAAAQERTLTALHQSQSAVIDAVESWAKAVQSSTPDLPAVPVLDALPTPEEIIKTSFDFYDKVLSAQREFAAKVVAAASPAIKTTPVKTATK